MLSHMVKVLGILLTAAAISLIEVPYMWKKGLKKELWLFSILLLFAVGICCAKALNWLIPTPLDWITAVYRPFSDFLTHIGLIK
ncbi:MULTISPECIES: hypothetical protein [Paenibacillus]|uniref:Uncharacterized protein n=3 Tax=Paenibacillus TaxID=44249 RepID=A0AAP4EB60_PAEPO|nr:MULTISPECIES: hypothetical protein [Paenibacillus]APB78505.2 hypothetical protein PPYC2_25125 [Paenibacillus polymyxa]MCP3747338.1 hypothetical protein [Paenibacillus sp. A3M_27_13]MDH2332705.1 hypothetical protein [Paenibacillus polymyxa]POR26848.1 hypothetical protein CG775_15625 [Paenibacillus polymyxa]QYK65194.1 hypothetical protein KAI36_00299 [Paenibacillus sp. S02]